MLQTHDRRRLRSAPPREADDNARAESDLPPRPVHHLTTVPPDTTNVVALFGRPGHPTETVPPATEDSRSALALRGWLVQSLLLEAIMRDEAGDLTAAEHALERALELAEHDRVLLPFTVDPLPALLERHARTHTTHTTLIAEILHLVAGFSPAPRSPRSGSMRALLTESEARVLRYLPTNLSKREIADELYVSVHTIKSHMKHLYAKLDAHTRGEAIQRAREYGLLRYSSRNPPAAAN
jgi:LuxR family transcriptional regulator, maltose regulon positive regulatory protein